jgi:hypothetical protein
MVPHTTRHIFGGINKSVGSASDCGPPVAEKENPVLHAAEWPLIEYGLEKPKQQESSR